MKRTCLSWIHNHESAYFPIAVLSFNLTSLVSSIEQEPSEMLLVEKFYGSLASDVHQPARDRRIFVGTYRVFRADTSNVPSPLRLGPRSA